MGFRKIAIRPPQARLHAIKPRKLTPVMPSAADGNAIIWRPVERLIRPANPAFVPPKPGSLS